MLNPDLPIQTAEEDLLNRGAFAQNLADAMIEYNSLEAFTIGLYGKWGSGKTSVINMVLENIEKRPELGSNLVVFRFNPWMCSDPKQLISQFFKQLSTKIKNKRPMLTKLYKFISDYSAVLSVFELIPVAGKMISALVLNRAVKQMETVDRDLQLHKDNIIKQLKIEDIKIIVAIDDIDRLTNDEINAVFQLVKSLADFPHTIYLVAFDREIVVRALEDIQKGKGAEYLDKIIQVPFELPSPNQNNINKVFFSNLEHIIGDIRNDEWDPDFWNVIFHYGIKDYLSSIRDVIRYSNILTLKLALLRSEVFPADLVALTCIQVFEPSAYAKLPFYKDDLCGGGRTSFMDTDRKKAALQIAFNDLIIDIEDRRRGAFTTLLSELFPNLKSLSINQPGGYRDIDNRGSLAHREISNAKCFDRYFALSLETDAIPHAAIHHLLYEASEDEIISLARQLSIEKKVSRFLEETIASLQLLQDTHFSERAQTIIKAIARAWEHLENDDQSDLDTTFSWKLLSCMDAFMEAINPADRFLTFRELIEDYHISLSTVFNLLNYLEKQHNRFSEGNRYVENPVVNIEELHMLEKIFQNRIIGAIDSNALHKNQNVISILWLFEQISPSLAEEKMKNLIKDESFFISLICGAVTQGKAYGRTIYSYWTVHKEIIRKYVDDKEAQERMLTFIASKGFYELSQDMKEKIAAFLIVMDSFDDKNSLVGEITQIMIQEKLIQIAHPPAYSS